MFDDEDYSDYVNSRIGYRYTDSVEMAKYKGQIDTDRYSIGLSDKLENPFKKESKEYEAWESGSKQVLDDIEKTFQEIIGS